MSRLKSIVEEGHRALVEDTKKRLRKAFELDVIAARDVPCTKADLFRRRMEKLSAERREIELRMSQVAGKLRFAVSDGDDPTLLIEASDNLSRAKRAYTDLIKRMRTQRKLHQRSCRIRK